MNQKFLKELLAYNWRHLFVYNLFSNIIRLITLIEKDNYKQNLEKSEKQLQQVVKENNTYKESLLKNENTIIYNKPIINIPTIHIIYQYTYKNNVSVTGFGDFIRCCFYILQFSDNYSINIDFNIYKHPIQAYLKYFFNK